MDYNGGGATVLVVEDDANALHVMRDHLARANFRVLVAANGWDALKQLKGGAVDLVVSELTIPDMDGSGLREKVMLNPETREIPFLFLVPDGHTDNLVTALRSGVDDCITKPCDPVVLVARVQAVLERRRAYEEMVRVDPLTRLLNRPSFGREVQDELNRIKRYDRFAALLMLDIDGFGHVNREGGVALGDLLLTCRSGVILSSKRNVDIAGRYRGERFVLCLPETPQEGAEVFAERIQERVAKIADSIAGMPITFTCGIAMAPEHGAETAELFDKLEATLHEAKAGGNAAIAVYGAGSAS